MKKILNNEWNRKNKYDLNKNEATPSLINHEVIDQNIFCETCSKSLYIDTRK